MSQFDQSYKTFVLQLTWKDRDGVGDTDKLGVRQLPFDEEKGEIIFDEEIIPDPEPIYTKVTDYIFEIGAWDRFEILQSIGQDIADMVLPDKGPEPTIRSRFIDFWWPDKNPQSIKSQNVRLRLLYPDDGDQAKLLNLLFEYMYLEPPHIEFSPANFFLGLRDDISIVHSLPPLSPSDLTTASINDFKVNMEYLSYLGSEQTEGKNIFNRFTEALLELKLVMDVKNLGDGIEEPIAESDNVKRALETQPFVHLTAHGGPVGQLILKGEGGELTPMMLNDLDLSRLKTVVLLNCSSGGAGDTNNESVGLNLHKVKGIPVVIGMSRSIDFPAAQRFVEGFYKALARWPLQGLERSIVEARNNIFSDRRGIHSVEFGYPRLFLRGLDSILIPEKLLWHSDELIKKFDKAIDKVNNDPPDVHLVDRNVLIAWIKQGGRKVHSRWYLVEGQLGIGKTAQIQILLKELKNSEIFPKILYHFCQNEQLATLDEKLTPLDPDDPLTFVRASLIPQLEQYFDWYKAQLLIKEIPFEKNYRELCHPEKYPLLVSNAEDALRYFVLEPLHKLRAFLKKLNLEYIAPVVIIDGINQVPQGQSRNNSILNLLFRFRDELDNLARFVLTTETPGDLDDESQQINETIRHLTHHQYTGPDWLIKTEIDLRDANTPLFGRMLKRTFESLLEEAQHRQTSVSVASRDPEDPYTAALTLVDELSKLSQNEEESYKGIKENIQVINPPLQVQTEFLEQLLDSSKSFMREFNQLSLTEMMPDIVDNELSRDLKERATRFTEYKNDREKLLNELESELLKILIRINSSRSIEPDPSILSMPNTLIKGGLEIVEALRNPELEFESLLEKFISIIQERDRVERRLNTQHFFTIIASTYDPISICDIAAIMNVPVSQIFELYKWSKRLFSDFFEENEADEITPDKKLAFFHSKIKKYFINRLPNNSTDINPHDLLFKACQNATGEDKIDWNNLRGTNWVARLAKTEEENTCLQLSSEDNQVKLLPPSTVQYVRRYLARHAYERYDQAIGQDRETYANDFLKLICDPAFRLIRFVKMGREASLEDVWDALRIVYTQYGLLSGNYDDYTTVHSLNRLIAANTPDSLIRDDLIQLEENIRQNDLGVRALFEALRLSWSADLQQQFGSRVFEYPV